MESHTRKRDRSARLRNGTKETAIAKVLNYDKCIDMFVSTSKALVRSFNEMGEAVQKMTNNLVPALQTIVDSMRQVCENMIQNDT